MYLTNFFSFRSLFRPHSFDWAKGRKVERRGHDAKKQCSGTVMSHSSVKVWWTKQYVSVSSVNESLNLFLYHASPIYGTVFVNTGVLFEKPFYRESMECSTYYRPNPPPYTGPSHRWGCGCMRFMWNLEHTAVVTDHITTNKLHA